MRNTAVDPKELAFQKECIEKIRKLNSAKKQMPKACVITYGCQQNENDSERIKGMLCSMGYELSETREECDVIIFNTCAVRENAEMKLKGNVGALKYLKAKRKDVIIGVCGCMVQQKEVAEILHSKFRHVELIFGTHAIYKFPQLLLEAKKSSVMDVEDCDGYIVEDIPVRHDDKYKAWVSVMYGCNNFCTYCVVPYVRGRERSRTFENVIAEITRLAEDGYKEVTLLGQNVNSYGKDLEDGKTFAQLLRAVNEIDGIERIRFATSHPKDISDELIDAMAECKKVCPQLHLPVQAGSNKVLKDMNRSYTREKYLETIKKVREKIPNIALSTDIIVGFPTETVEDFKETVSLVKEVRYDSMFTFIYSRRRGTKAATMDFVLSEEQIQKNFDELLEVQNKISREINETYAGKTVEIFVDGYSKNDPETLQGRTPENKIVNFKGDSSLIGKIINIKISEVRTWSLNGELE
ncbi:MAG: tRNA (N6-isopentenyl adenosine(37)-C2)-methylthiotransferase MiaB [Clostridia bacterium]|nr:tRNA (N6-isopentenyl adenosine(37)-C2)-methylthiotransferase MiaB [Clostridia bacterium]